MNLVLPPVFPGPRGTLAAAKALVEQAGLSASAVKVREEHGHFLLQTVVLSVGRRRLALRTAHPARAFLLRREAFALTHLAGSGLAPTLLAHSDGTTALPQPHHLLELPAGGPPTLPLSHEETFGMGELLGLLHRQNDVSLRRRSPSLGAVSLMAAFQALSDDVRAYLNRRERDGLPQDLLTVNLSDLMRALRRYVVAAEHHFLPPPSRVLCHGALDAQRFVVTPGGGRMLWGFEHAFAGDGALDLAQLCERSSLTEEQVLGLLDGYRATRGRRDGLLLARLCAWRVLFRLQRAVGALRELQDLTDLLDEGLAGQTDALDGFVTAAREDMRLAINGLMDFTGPARPFSLREVEAMGALIAVEELHLRGSCPVLGIEGPAYTGKTPLAQELGRRLRVPWVGVAAVLRAAAWATGAPDAVDDRTLADMLQRLQVHVVDNRLQLMWDGQDALTAARGDDVRLPAGLATSARVRQALSEFLRRACVRGAVVEGQDLDGILPPGAHSFLLWANTAVRDSRRDAHLQTTPPVDAPPPAVDDVPPVPAAHQVLLDGSNLGLPQLVRTVLCTLVPGAAGHADSSLSGRPLLFS
jgi:cytidylate kinase